MKRALPFVLVLAAGLAIGYVVGSQSDVPVIPDGPTPADRPEPPPVSALVPPPVPENRYDEMVRQVADLRALVKRLKAEHPYADGNDAALEGPILTGEASEDPEKGDLRILVVDGQGTPLPNTKVSVVRYEGGKTAQKEDAVTDAAGTAVVRKLEDAKHYVNVNIGTGVRSMTVPVVAGRVTEVRFEVAPGVEVTGVVRDHEKGPLAKVSVTLVGTKNQVRATLGARTDEEGRYRIRNVPPGAYTISASGGAIGYSRRPQARLTVKVPGPVTKDIVVGLPGLSGVVRDKDTGRPIAGVSVQIQRGVFRNVSTDVAGKFTFLDLPKGSYQLVVSKKGYGLIFLKDVKGDGPLTIELQRAATIRLTVTRPNGEPYVGRLYLGISPVEKGKGTSVGTSVTADEDGRAVYDKLVPGKYRLDLRADGVGAAKVTVAVRVGETSIDVSLK